MTLRDDLADPARLGDAEWLAKKFPDVANMYRNSNDRTEAAETLCLWGQRFVKALQKHDNNVTLQQEGYLIEEMDKVMFTMVDRWSNGNPSYIIALRKALQYMLIIREQPFLAKDLDTMIVSLAKHASDYSRDDPRIAFGSLEAMARSSFSNCEKVRNALPSQFIAKAFEILVREESRSGMVGRCLMVILGTNQPPSSWFEYVKPYVSDSENYQAIMTYFVEPMLKQSRDSMAIFQQFYELCKPQSSASVEVGVLKAAKNAKLDVSNQIQSSEAIATSLCSLSRNLRFDALNLLCCATRKLTAPVPKAVFKLIIANIPSLLAEGEPKSRADVYSAFKNILIRINTSKSRAEAEDLINCISAWCSKSLIPGMPYRCLTTATNLLELFVEYGFQDEVFSKDVILGLVNCVTSDFADIRESCVSLLEKVNDLSQVDNNYDLLVQHAFKLLQGGRTGDSGARLLEFLNARRPESNLGDHIYDELNNILKIAREDVTEASKVTCIYGYITALRVVPPKNHAPIPMMLEICRICTPPLMSTAPEGSADELLNFCWKAVKESSLLIESYAAANYSEGIQGNLGSVSVIALLDELAYMLTEITHWGAFSAVPPAYLAVAKFNWEKAHEIVWNKLRELSSRNKSRSVTRRSAGLPLLITSTLTVHFDEKIVDALFELATLPFVEGEVMELEMPQVHGMNCLKAVFTDANITKPTAKFIERALELSFGRFESSVWSLRNCAAMMFTSLFKRLFGVRGLPVPASVFFQRFRKLQPLITKQLLTTDKHSDLQAVYPALAILAKLQTVSKDERTLDDYWTPIIELLGSPSWKIREIAARVVVSMTHINLVYEVVTEFALSLNLKDQNQMHGLALAINGLLDAKATGTSTDIESLSLDKDDDDYTMDMRAPLQKIKEIILKNTCMETQTELIMAWQKLGGRGRLIPFEKLPSPLYLNPSIATFESKQAKYAPAKAENYSKNWSQVLRALPTHFWTKELAREVLTDPSQQPDLQAHCMRVLNSSDFASELTELALLKLNSNQPVCVRQEALKLASHSRKLDTHPQFFDSWLREVIEFSKDESPVESRRSAIRSIGIYLSEERDNYLGLNDDLLYTLFTLLSDEELDIRESAALITSNYLKFPAAKAPPACELKLLECIDATFITNKLTVNLVEDSKMARQTFDTPNEMIFVVEKESLYRDQVRNIMNHAKYCKVSSTSDNIASEASSFLNGLDFDAPLQASASSELVEVKTRIEALSSL